MTSKLELVCAAKNRELLVPTGGSKEALRRVEEAISVEEEGRKVTVLLRIINNKN